MRVQFVSIGCLNIIRNRQMLFFGNIFWGWTGEKPSHWKEETEEGKDLFCTGGEIIVNDLITEHWRANDHWCLCQTWHCIMMMIMKASPHIYKPFVFHFIFKCCWHSASHSESKGVNSDYKCQGKKCIFVTSSRWRPQCMGDAGWVRAWSLGC